MESMYEVLALNFKSSTDEKKNAVTIHMKSGTSHFGYVREISDTSKIVKIRIVNPSGKSFQDAYLDINSIESILATSV
ncbi:MULTISPECIES: hypothetical protein [Undibacterium]|uniref:Uncharacterized protein n=1 Tax=Undibacterium umbellatum TaxID=2762300 RepID=A0ABR6ZE03_9BURK|nr:MULTISPECIES: hypothetical protein [Undibacterium]MBC3909966.1 hypothetical protein [Undibacterium umbellatum]MDP1976925.1 hypothetical protein [Undibacterium sp.]